ncbi:MAG: hypothetical protein JJU19_06775 [Pararhodobacter sp.]|nr:hypothetical protein [Pararhodobacter sp.]
MFNSLDILRMAQAFATHAAARQGAIAQNVANADTPGYRARDAVPFSTFYSQLRTDPGSSTRPMIRPDATPATRTPDGNTVSVEHEMMRAAAARQQHETALGIYAMARDMMRASIGR